ncbi:glycosyl hydrolase 115 family protein [Pelagicoccus sp. SDUM812003]|uniref:glycosyl hydrolase 115 family protein n=1 Tax=Pelagicoccus sp. SDUM812003 TaxID=3041267 RepID=UPI00280D797C|nr:glycosyl hydrolase 115 family protein [Pelagicoccus sp. SDUM812003]MDQ8205302.1 glycosyl hydrolase 115 family protein [Pelagicoccus sp. SDUM812003]
MKSLRKLHLFAVWSIILAFTSPALGEVRIVEQLAAQESGFPIFNDGSAARLVVDSHDATLVDKVARLFAQDIERVTRQKAKVVDAAQTFPERSILIGTIDGNQRIRQLVESGKLDVSDIEGKWERYIVQTVANPFPGVEQVLVIVGSDRRGAAYGVLSISEAMGVSPWYYWADVPVERKAAVFVTGEREVSPAPTVRYRGIFLNDEDWGLQPWAAQTFEPEVGDIGPRTYEKVFELLLRLKANMVAPAMHECTQAFFTVPGNMEMADDYGIMITTSHCEPLLYNNASEWDKATQGEWNYQENKHEIVRSLDERVAQAAGNENIYTIALRGMHDEGMIGVEDSSKVKVLEQAALDQRRILAKHIDRPIEEIPQIFVPYKEVLGIYEQGMKLPEEITIVWPDDNYGYIKKLSNSEERKRSGGSGVYYHISYLGWPNDYLWLNSTPPALMYSELQRAYSLGADKYWLLNVGDIKPGEMGMQQFLDMAWDFSSFDFGMAHDYQAKQLAQLFGEKYTEDLAYIFDRYYYHGFLRKPEFMTGDYRWNSLFEKEDIKDVGFSFESYDEAENRLAEYQRIADKAEGILEELPPEKKAAFFQLVYYPVKGAMLYNSQMLLGSKNRWYATQGRASANGLVSLIVQSQQALAHLTEEYNSLLDGKWKGMMTAPGFLPEPQLPLTDTVSLADEPQWDVFVEEGGSDENGKPKLPTFSKYTPSEYAIEVFSKSLKSIHWSAKATNEWILLSRTQGETYGTDRVAVSIDWEQAPVGEAVGGSIVIESGEERREIEVSVFNPASPNAADLEGLFVENAGVVSIAPADFQRKEEHGEVTFQVIEGLGYSNKALQLGSSVLDEGNGSYVEYDFYTFSSGTATVKVFMLPLFAKDREHGTRYGIQVDDTEYRVFDNDVKEYSMDWAHNVMRNAAINSFEVAIDEPGRHTLKIFCEDPGMIVQKVLIDLGGLKPSYHGPESTLK